MYTINNYTEEDVLLMQNLECSYHIFGKEVSESGTPHLQGCITFSKAARFVTVNRYIKGHLQRPKIVEQARNYCTKEGDYWIKDTRTQGERTDLNQITTDLMAGMPLKQAAWKHPLVYVKYPTGMKDLHSFAQKRRDFKPVISWFFGPTGTGKSKFVFDNEPEIWVSGRNSKFFNGYENQEAAVLDDFRGSFCPFDELLKLLDRYPHSVDVKGSHREWNSRRIYITSCYRPEEAYPGCAEKMDQLLRRLDRIVEFSIVGSIYGIQRVMKDENTVYIPVQAPAISETFIE